ncbi:2-oxoglutarate dehydrogenase complex dihydrolipoyllysine-residue succinyltransferase [Salipaludibacillus agaradhaerens]|uniref:Dihydrolipoyllysine-residue succinyltransferase component of 2-oxoglutarate dehydrogenase complex n=1 Tax=Salipaludibacillus agaradhaerens TaxID=76935 RepID=A0A9Q4B1H3_SALAG|nr:2-oxoglutarate dehydrogenase complex dihydrolipoyllysine-residue succinyltransferase [Salipaludibacillus agaradhaerens]MCR6096425.1 2-oxoglutarate dehydrogenase complex dihydrolipoyllysine-residue succinyltransferase [Salipaludibacillus agaradhaerens]MCR6114016.1 2-oxoglutarate dehydrogenase complex dihydrolipoyllysine-residue succinyltransferase [Salipaludibacillus agaradhaerens]
MLEIKVPELAESVTEGTVAEWLKQPGDYVEKGEDIVELETDKVNVEISAEEAGILEEAVVEPGETVKVGDVIARMNTNAKEAEESSKGQSTEKQLQTSLENSTKENNDSGHIPKKGENEFSDEHHRLLASPATRKYAREQGIKLNEIHPRDPLGKIRKEDIDEHKGNRNQTSGSSSLDSSEPKASSQDPNKPVERIKMSRRRQTIAKRLVQAQQTAAMLTTFNEVDMTNLMDLRKRRKDKFLENNGVKLGFMSFFTKAVIGALKKYPYVNAEIDGDEIILKKFYDIGVAVSTEDGLIVPVVRDADRLDFAGIEKEIGQLAEKAHEKKLALNELQGGSFTITNGGVFGSLWSTPILNTPQVGILGMHKIQMRPVAIDNDRFENRPMMYIALSYDHRIIDGKDAVGFLVKVKELIEDPESLLLEG